MSSSPVRLRAALTIAATLGLASPALAETGLGEIRFDQWGFFQKNPDGTEQWQYRPRIYVPWQSADGWVFTQRADLPMLYADGTGSGNPGGGFSGGIGNAFLESIVDVPTASTDLHWRVSLRLTFPSPKGSPFGKDNQYQIAPSVGVRYRMADTWNGVTLEPYLRYNWGFHPDPASTQLVSTLDLYPAARFGLDGGWSLMLYPENPITYDRSSGQWFVPLDFMLIRRVSKTFEFGIGAAVKLGNPSNPSYDYIIDGRATFYF